MNGKKSASEYTINRFLGDIPSDWKGDYLDNITNKITDGTHNTPKYTSKGIPFLRVTDIQSVLIDLSQVKFISEEEHNQLIKRCQPEKGDILLSKNGSIGICKIIDWDWDFSIFVSLCLIKIKHNLLVANFLKEFFASYIFEKQIYARSKQGTVTNLHLEEIKKTVIPLPPLDEQKKIAEILGTCDRTLELTEKLLTAKRKLKQALMQKLLTGKLRFPEFVKISIETYRLRDLLVLTSGKTKPLNTTENSTSHNRIPVLGGNGILGYTFLNNIEGKNIVIGRVGEYCGITRYIDYPAWITDNALYTKEISSKCNPNFLAYALQHFDLSQLRNQSGQPLVSQTPIYAVKINLPSIPEQEKIASCLNNLNDEIHILEKQKQLLTKQKKALMQKLLTGKIRVKTDN